MGAQGSWRALTGGHLGRNAGSPTGSQWPLRRDSDQWRRTWTLPTTALTLEVDSFPDTLMSPCGTLSAEPGSHLASQRLSKDVGF